VLKTLLMPSEPIRALSGVNVPGFPMAGFQLTLYGRIWATPEEHLTKILYEQLWNMCRPCPTHAFHSTDGFPRISINKVRREKKSAHWTIRSAMNAVVLSVFWTGSRATDSGGLC